MISLDDKLERLGITRDMREACRTPPCPEAQTLTDAGVDMFGRAQQMTPETLDAWTRMKAAALAEGVELKLVSAFRSIDYQCEVIQRKLDTGRTIDDIMQVNAIPGHSEHHSGRALDLHAGDEEPLTEAFESTGAFTWLCQHAGKYGFHLSYPKDNPEGIAYEPWHWCFRE